jgi:nucleotide-binding universal stress UspA family protein
MIRQPEGTSMSARIVVGVDEGKAVERVLSFARKLGSQIGQSEAILVHVIEWSGFSFQTPEQNAERHKRREEEAREAQARIVDPAVKLLTDAGVTARGLVRHGKVSEVLDQIATEERADLIVIGRSTGGGIAERIFGSSADALVKNAGVPVTVVG